MLNLNTTHADVAGPQFAEIYRDAVKALPAWANTEAFRKAYYAELIACRGAFVYGKWELWLCYSTYNQPVPDYTNGGCFVKQSKAFTGVVFKRADNLYHGSGQERLVAFTLEG